MVAKSKTDKVEIQLAGKVVLDGDAGLAFQPYISPSVRIRELGFTRWDADLGQWVQAWKHIDQATVDGLIRVFGPIEVDPEVTVKLNPPPVLLPKWIIKNDTLFGHQKDAVEYAINHTHSMMALAPGLGKTAIAILASQAVKAQHILVIAPLTLLYVWRNEIRQWAGKDEPIVFCYSKNLLLPSKWTLTNYDTVRRMPVKFATTKWDAIIIDESLMVKNRKAKRTLAVKSVVKSSKAGCVWLLSGSPVSRLNDDLWSQLNIINPYRFSAYWRFTERVCYVEKDAWGWKVKENRLPIEDLQREMSEVFFARTQEQVLDLPPWIFSDVPVEMTKRQAKLYTQMEQEFITQLDEYDDDTRIGAANVLAQMVRLLQLASNPLLIGGPDTSAKWDAVSELMEYEAGPFIVWNLFKNTATHLAGKLYHNHEIGILNGDVLPKTRQQIVDNFQSGKLDVLIVHPGVGKYGLTLTAAHTSVYVERGNDSDGYYQSLYRVRRIGTTSSPHIIHLLSVKPDGSGTIDHVIGRVLATRKDNAIKLTTGELKRLMREEYT